MILWNCATVVDLWSSLSQIPSLYIVNFCLDLIHVIARIELQSWFPNNFHGTVMSICIMLSNIYYPLDIENIFFFSAWDLWEKWKKSLLWKKSLYYLGKTPWYLSIDKIPQILFLNYFILFFRNWLWCSLISQDSYLKKIVLNFEKCDCIEK